MNVYESPVSLLVALEEERLVCASPYDENTYGDENEAGGDLNWQDEGEF